MSAVELRRIAISKENYEWLGSLGHTPESFNDVITKLRLKNASLVEKEGGRSILSQQSSTITAAATEEEE